MSRGKVVLVGTPIGNLDDMGARGIQTLKDADVIACEDTRRTRKLLSHFAINARELVVYNDINERDQASALVDRALSGKMVALVSDAGMPGIADPGYRVVAACVSAGVEVDVVPGPSAAVAALAISGLPTDRFVFEGFLPRKSAQRRTRLETLASDDRTIVVYESPHRIESSLVDVLEVLGPRRAALARELTKLYGEIRRGTIDELLAGVREQGVRGEVVLVVEGAPRAAGAVDAGELASRAKELMRRGADRKEAMAQVAREAGVPRRKVFDALIVED